MGEDFVLDDRSVVVDEDVFDGEGGDFGKQDAAKSVGDGSVDTDQGEAGVERFEFVELDVEGLWE